LTLFASTRARCLSAEKAEIEIGKMQIRLRAIFGKIQTELQSDAIDGRDHRPIVVLKDTAA
jgi:hypothetical protein